MSSSVQGHGTRLENNISFFSCISLLRSLCEEGIGQLDRTTRNVTNQAGSIQVTIKLNPDSCKIEPVSDQPVKPSECSQSFIIGRGKFVKAIMFRNTHNCTIKRQIRFSK
ncbi:hypothetical protein PGT21_031066 [Puccinia graminis f. sp. tritici]|uniref:Uncharacterized protein n=1 Tax=Puccinia graminis f. sp. tritici TaxID=56615 RepID=A0A5B0P8G3_PUCGR|nr:hypothetical protein PGT21_031066 [Puccinia graminis f. sp. tritici]